MFPLRMTHPKNGATYAHDNSEAERLRKLGWSEQTTAEALTALNAAIDAHRAEPLARVKRKYTRKAN